MEKWRRISLGKGLDETYQALCQITGNKVDLGRQTHPVCRDREQRVRSVLAS